MDASTLSTLIDTSSQELAQLHSRLGCPAEELHRATAALKTCIHDAIHAQVRQVQAQVNDVEEACAELEGENVRLCRATGETLALDATDAVPLLAQRAALEEEKARLDRIYKSQLEQCDLVVEQIETLNACMSGAGGASPSPSMLPGEGAQLRDASPAFLRTLEAHWQEVQRVYTDRKVEMESQLSEILQLWAELCLMPSVTVKGTRLELDDAACRAQSEFHIAILYYTQQIPVIDADGAFTGEYAAMPLDTPRRAPLVDTSAMQDTPTRLSDDQQSAPLVAEHHERKGTLLQPTDDVLAQSTALRASLEQEKVQRETRIQTYYDELCELWMRFDVPETEMDAFVLDHRGSTLTIVAAYKDELDKMRQLKSQHMSLFISKTREQIWELWDALFMADGERNDMFPAYFLALPAADEERTATGFDWDHVLAQHEQMCARLNEMLEQRAPLLQLIGKYRAICDEARALEESAHDTTRLLGRGNRGDPGRLLREEKMRKRVKIQKPKIEHELLRVIPDWETEHNMPFLMDGTRFVDYLRDQLGGAKENARELHAKPATHGERLGASRTANVPATPHVAKRPPSVRPAAKAPGTGVRRAATAQATARPRVASNARHTPYGDTRSGAQTPHGANARMRDQRLVSQCTSGDETTVDMELDRTFEHRTPSTALESTLARVATPAGPW
ncbi:putative protein kinase YGL059W [Malassezia vespertilionis]|uniref:Uncharacterized protein n=1 Tax=Malassezia vespertilionis TaxID=2020962 RepID=A0A2N1JGU6_9BASI|nr:putative protein kinase YGL059W [Malassezia vespertilionis]PKI85771.1 hypothetical protein MVES_000724 [Malassezia vespertilionis]WFD05434.1 putative protein kinase YGL059W [Malassezia vespertilionis]